jgi:NADPH:quinone reductase
VEPFDPQLLQRKGSLLSTRPTIAHYVASRSELLWRTEELMAWVRNGLLRVRIDRQFPLGAAAEAHAELEGRRTTGKVLLAP